MATHRLTLMPFPQRWDGAALELRVLVSPVGNPLAPLAVGGPAFADGLVPLRALLIPSTEKMPAPADVAAVVPLANPPPAAAAAAFRELERQLPIDPAPPAKPPLGTTQIWKFLTPSYRTAFAFDGPRTPFAVTDNRYFCALDGAMPPAVPRPIPAAVSWGKVMALAVRQPRLAEALGLMYAATLPLPAADFFRDGGWLYLGLDPAGDFAAAAAANPGFLRLYAARIPPLTAGEPRPVFAPVLFPVAAAPAAASLDEVFAEADTYDDGFAKIVHSFQATRSDPRDLSDGGRTATVADRPYHDEGIKLGWDDEQLVIWMNRQVTEDKQHNLAGRDTPAGVRAYRVDVRPAGAAEWSSLCRVTGALQLGPIDLGSADGELGVEVAPAQLNGGRDGDYWLPLYFTRWTGRSLVAADPTPALLAGQARPASQTVPVGEDDVPLRYGRDYDIRVRLVDLAGGGPGVDDEPVNPSTAATGRRAFRRHLPPGPVSLGPVPANGDAVRVTRPRLGYPAAVFTGLANARQAVLDDIVAAKADARPPGVFDPDVSVLRIDVAVGSPEFDPGNETAAGDPRRHLYTTVRPFPADPAAVLELTVRYRDEADLEKFPDPAATGDLLLPTARTVFLTLTPVARPDPAMLAAGAADPALVPVPDAAEMGRADPNLAYFGSQAARVGPATTVRLRRESADETGLLADHPTRPFQVLLLRHDEPPNGVLVTGEQAATGRRGEARTDVAGRLADRLDLDHDGLRFFDRPGGRTAFGCSAALAHALSPDRSAVTFSSVPDLCGRWLAVVSLRVQRDWTWDGLADGGFEVTRRIDGGPAEVVGDVPLPRAVNATAVRPPGPARDSTTVVFVDAMDPKPAAGRHPAEMTVEYTVTPRLRSAAAADDPWVRSVRLPIAAPPTQVPRLASAGTALTAYAHDATYSATDPQRRWLWLEFDEPVLNPRDGLFARVLAHAADPLLTTEPPAEYPPVDEPPLPLDPELIRIITPGQPDVAAGLTAMQRLEPSPSPRHFLLPLPTGLGEGSPELFGFFTYELRVGHWDGWSTAQARFGPPLRVSGVQHPPPPLTCTVARDRAGILAASGFAVPVTGGRRPAAFSPRTQVWGLLYAQVAQLDGDGWRNVLLARTQARIDERDLGGRGGPQPYGRAYWDHTDVARRLRALGLPHDARLSVLTVELLPEPLSPFRDPLGEDLGEVRILRTSPLTPVPAVCVE